MDDCSTDDSLAVLQKLSMQHPQIVVVASLENKGVSATRNTAIRSARGTFIWFVDPDDLLYPGAVERMYKAISETSQNVIIGNYMKVKMSMRRRSHKHIVSSVILSWQTALFVVFVLIVAMRMPVAISAKAVVNCWSQWS